jgi:hypothetical protein
MNIESNRNALNIPSWYSRANMADQSGESPSFQPMPSIPPDHLEPSGVMRRVDAKLDHLDGVLRQLDICLAIIYRLLPRDRDGEAIGMSLDSFRTEAGPRAQVIKNGNSYDISKRKAGGS